MKPSKIFTNLKSRLKNSAARLRRNEEGLAAIEFAIIAPLLITMYFGLAEVATAIAHDRAVSHATNVAGDLAAQVSNIDKDDLEDIMSATLRVMDVDDASKVTIVLNSWKRDSSGKVYNVGEARMNNGAAALKAINAEKIDTSLLNENSGVVVARVSYNYSPLKLQFMKTDFTMKEMFILKPRRSSEVTFDNSVGKVFNCSGVGKTVKC